MGEMEAAAVVANHILKTGEVSAMIKLGFLPSTVSPTSSPPSSYRFSPFIAHSSPPQPKTMTSSLFDIITEEDRRQHQRSPKTHPSEPKLLLLQKRISEICSDGTYERWGIGDVLMTVSSKDGDFRVSMRVHKRVLASRSRFFEDKFGKDGAKKKSRHVVEISECDDVEVYVEVVALMYCEDLQTIIKGERVLKVLDLLQISEAIMFKDGVDSCLKHLEMAPWSEEEERKVVSVLSQFQQCRQVSEILRRVSVEPSTSSQSDEIVCRLMVGILSAKDEKARREMKALVLKLLTEDGSRRNVENRETIYNLCNKCINSMLMCLSDAIEVEENHEDRGIIISEIARQANNLIWLAEILISKSMGEDFVMLWAEQKELAMLHAKIPCVYRYEMSRITAQLCIAIGRGQILVPKETRFSLVQTWLGALYDDFSWMKRGCRSLDKKMVEDGLSQTILTLPMSQQQMILLDWFERFLSKGDDCPNIHEAFATWWKRAFGRHHAEGELDRSRLQIARCNFSS